MGAARPGGEAAPQLAQPAVNTEAMQVFLDRFAETLAEGEYAILVLDGAVVDACCAVWNAIADDAGRIRSLCHHPWIRKVIG